MIKVNLLSPEKKEIGGGPSDAPGFSQESKENKLNIAAAVGAIGLTLVVIGFMYFVQANTIEEKQTLLKEREARKQQLDTVLQTLLELEKAKNLLDRKVKLIANLKSRQQDSVKMMDQLSNALPDWIWLQSLSFSGKLLSISGKALHNNLISDFINNLRGTGYFNSIRFHNSTRQRQGSQDVFNFKISCYYEDKDMVKENMPAKPITKKK